MGPSTPLEEIASPEAILQSLPAHIAVVDSAGRIVEVNDAWRRFAAANGLPPDRCGLGTDYLRICATAARDGIPEAAAARDGIREVLQGTRDSFTLEYPCHGPHVRRWFSMTVTPLGGPRRGAVVMHMDITARRVAEEALREKTALLRTAQRIAGIGYWHVDAATRALFLSEEACAILGDEACARGHYADYMRRVHVADRADLDLRIRAALAGGPGFDLQHRIVRSDGSVRWLRVRAEMQASDGEVPARLYGTIMDVTERRYAGEALRQSEARHREAAHELASILDSSLDVICTLDEQGKVARISAACERILGYRPEELVGTRLVDLLVPEDLGPSLEAEASVRAGHPATSYENRLRRKDGSVVTIAWSARWSAEQSTIFCVGRDVSEAKLIAEANRHLAERLHETLEAMTDALIVVDRGLRVRFVNRAAERALDIPRETLVGRSLPEAFDNAESPRFIERYREAILTNRPVIFEDYYGPLGLWIEVRAFPSSEGLAIYFRDITERHRAQAALQASEARFRAVAEATTDATWDWDVSANHAWWSEGFTRLSGVAAGPVGLERWLDCIHPDDRERVHTGIREALQGRDSLWGARYRFRRADGSFAQVLDRGYVMRDADGQAVRMVGGLNDLTAELEAENRLREQAQLLDAARDAIQVHDLQKRILYWNRGAERLYGWTAAETVGHPGPEVVEGETSAFNAAWEAVLRDGEWKGELEKVDRGGRKRVVEARWTLIRDAEGKPQRVLSIATDVTERRDLERQLIRVQRVESIGTLAGGIAHDLNNVLTPILMSANLLQHAVRDPEEAELVAAISSSAQRGADMITQLLSFARGVEGQHVPFSPSLVLRDVRKIVADTFPRSIEMIVDVEEGLPAVVGDATQLHQVLLNLCVNARDAMPHGGTLSIAARLEDARAGWNEPGGAASPAYVVLEVQDTGTGMEPAVMEKIFDPFFTTKDVGKGTGLGLATSLSIVQRHGGFIRVASRKGEGSRFTVYLPATTEAAQPQGAPGEPLPRGDGRTVLVVDDEEPIRRVAEQILRSYGYEVIVAADGAEAIALYAKLRRTIDIVLVDMMMPFMDGPTTIQALKRIGPAAVIVATSGITDDANVSKALSAGARSFLAKPYGAESLLRGLDRALGRLSEASVPPGLAGPS